MFPLLLGFLLGVGVTVVAVSQLVVSPLKRKHKRERRELKQMMALLLESKLEAMGVVPKNRKKDKEGNVLSPIQHIPEGS